MLEQNQKVESGRTQERNRISEELHDGVIGKLFGTRMGLGFLKLDVDPKTTKKHQEFINDLQHLEKDIRDISHDLINTEKYKTENFAALIKHLVTEQSILGNYEFELHIDDAILWSEISIFIKMNLYRIVQESIHNVNKYAKASKILADFRIQDKNIQLKISDNGVGFNVSKKSKGIGLKNMKSRTRKIHGEMKLISNEKGTSLEIVVPVTT